MNPRTWSACLGDLGRRTFIMGILNVTPDSFSDGGRHASTMAALDHARAMKLAGADIIDVGGESTRPGAKTITIEEEIGRVARVILALKKDGIGLISVDTTKSEVARRALELGADIVNDVSGGTFDPGILRVARDANALVVLAHTRGPPESMQKGTWRYEGGVVRAVKSALIACVARAEQANIPRDAITIDPGFGFGKTVEENLELLRGLDVLGDLGLPILVGTSRKSFVGAITGRAVDAREWGTAATVALAISRGATMVRVHDVAAMHDVVRMTDAIVRGSRPQTD